MSFLQQSNYNKEEILDCAEGNLFGQENGRLPTPNMLMFDRITEINMDGGNFSKGQIKAELDTTIEAITSNLRTSSTILFIDLSFSAIFKKVSLITNHI